MDVQTDFIEKVARNSKLKLNNENNKSNIENKILILKRLDEKYVQFDWLDILNDDLDFFDKIKSNLKLFTSNDEKLQHRMIIPQFYEESSQVNIE